MKRCVLLAVIIFVTALSIGSNQKVYAKTVLHLDECGTVLDIFKGNDEIIYILCSCQDNYKIITLDSEFNSNIKALNISVSKSSYAFNGDTFLFFANDYENYDSEISIIADTYNCNSGVRSRKAINNVFVEEGGSAAVDDGGNMYISENGYIYVCSKNYVFKEKLADDVYSDRLTNSYDRELVFCPDRSGLTIIYDGEIYKYDIACNKIFPAGENVFSDESGKMYCFENGEVGVLYDGFDSSHGGCIVSDWVIGCENGRIKAVNTRDNEELLLHLSSIDPYIIPQGDGFVILYQQDENIEAERITISELEDILEESKEKQNDTTDLSELVKNIEPDTYVSSFLAGINKEQYFLFSANGKKKTGGLVVTGDYVEDMVTGECRTVIICGDVDGTGTVNNSDMSCIANYLLGSKILDGCFFEAADINGDNSVDLRDYAMLDGYIKGKL